MAELTIQVPDELAQRLEPYKERLPELLAQLVETISPNTSSANSLPSVSNPTQRSSPAYAEVIDFLIARPTPQEISAFKVSAVAQARIRILLDKNREETLSESEAAELDVYEQLEYLMILLKAKAYTSMSQ